MFTSWINAHAKAFGSALVGGLSMYWALRSNGMTADEWMTVVATVLGAFGITWYVPNNGIMTPLPQTKTETTVTTKPDERTLAEVRAEVAP